MSRVFIDGFEGGQWAGWDYTYVVAVNTPYSMTGSFCGYLTWGGVAKKNIPSASEYYFSMRYHPRQAQNMGILGTLEGSTYHIAFNQINDTGGVRIGCYRFSTLVGSSSQIYPLNQEHLFEAYVKIDASSGQAICKMNGVEVINFKGNTQNGGAGVIDNFQPGVTYQSYTTNCYFDDIVVDNANWIGGTRILGRAVEANGANNDWTPSAGNNYECVDEVPPDASDYVYTNVGSNYDLYQVKSADITDLEAIKCVQVCAFGWQEGAPTPVNIQPMVRAGATPALYYGASSATQTTSYGHWTLWENNPDTASPWVLSQVNSLQIGMQALT